VIITIGANVQFGLSSRVIDGSRGG